MDEPEVRNVQKPLDLASREASDVDRRANNLLKLGGPDCVPFDTIYVKRGLDNVLARQVAVQLMASDALGAHARDELGISPEMAARPVQAAVASAGSFAFGALPPVLIAVLSPVGLIPQLVGAGSIVFLAVLGALGAKTGGANVLKGAVRVTFWGAIAMAVTARIGVLFGTHV